jgi:signal recognition particle GTPase
LSDELLLDRLIESERLPTESEAALEAEDARLSARQMNVAAIPSSITQAERVRQGFIGHSRKSRNTR